MKATNFDCNFLSFQKKRTDIHSQRPRNAREGSLQVFEALSSWSLFFFTSEICNRYHRLVLQSKPSLRMRWELLTHGPAIIEKGSERCGANTTFWKGLLLPQVKDEMRNLLSSMQQCATSEGHGHSFINDIFSRLKKLKPLSVVRQWFEKNVALASRLLHRKTTWFDPDFPTKASRIESERKSNWRWSRVTI